MKHSSPDLVFGTGGRFGRLSQSLADKLVSYALSQNVTTFDTGFEYCNGKSQLKLVEALRPACLRNRSSFKFSTKFKAPKTHGVITNCLSRTLASPLQYIDYLFIWGPSISELSSPFLFDELVLLRDNGLINSIGVNTHDLNCLEYLAENISSFPIDHIMLDFNLLRQDRLPVMKKFSNHGVKIWSGTALCQGFLVQSLFELFLRTRSISYLARAILQPETRILLDNSKALRRFLRANYPDFFRIIPLKYVLQCELVDFVPLGMLSSSSISRNVLASTVPIPQSLILEVEDWAREFVQLV